MNTEHETLIKNGVVNLLQQNTLAEQGRAKPF